MYSLYMKGKMQQILQIENTGQSLFPGLYVWPGKKKKGNKLRLRRGYHF